LSDRTPEDQDTIKLNKKVGMGAEPAFSGSARLGYRGGSRALKTYIFMHRNIDFKGTNEYNKEAINVQSTNI
jgi:hypothetical protein